MLSAVVGLPELALLLKAAVATVRAATITIDAAASGYSHTSILYSVLHDVNVDGFGRENDICTRRCIYVHDKQAVE